ncbi:folylpolyglutamate synthase/dihydrofolate synthase family protein [Fulvivirga lutimaris]|uniref:bifunctional folylpolyglutamate synthase/dihydrofolate synthase n=1 Tax=Fulvivirga lutimaris TaxID=1819566 RepID=UPI0031B58860
MDIDLEYENTVKFLFSQLPMFQRDGASAYKKDLTNTVKLCQFLGHPEHQFKSVHVAGTNGKGSSSHYLAAIMQKAGYKTGLYTSPHLKSFTERIKINGVEITKEAVVEFVDLIKPLIEEIQPSFFEITVAMCFHYFAKEQVDIAIIEVGMGGRLDSTNVIIPEVALITNISNDHQQWLGNDIKTIAGEKAGIIKEHIPTVISERQTEIEDVFIERSRELNSDLYFAEDDVQIGVDDGLVISTNNMEIKVHNVQEAAYQQRNLKGVIKAVGVLRGRGFDVDDDAIVAGVEEAFTITGLKGRWQKLGSKPAKYCDVGHNEAGLKYVVNQINNYQYDKLHIVIGVVNDKELTSVMQLLPMEAQYYFCQADIPRALPAAKLQQVASEYDLIGYCIPNVNKAIEVAENNATENDFIFIGGSNFVVAEIEGL